MPFADGDPVVEGKPLSMETVAIAGDCTEETFMKINKAWRR
jgi:hypothetical protein